MSGGSTQVRIPDAVHEPYLTEVNDAHGGNISKCFAHIIEQQLSGFAEFVKNSSREEFLARYNAVHKLPKRESRENPVLSHDHHGGLDEAVSLMKRQDLKPANKRGVLLCLMADRYDIQP